MKNTLQDERLAKNFSEDDKRVIEESCARGLKFVANATDAEHDEYDAKQKELENKYNPIMMRVYQQAGVS
jgi:heat shock protein 1/8